MIKNCMKRNVFSIPFSATVRQAAEVMVERRVGLLPVLSEESKPLGIVMLADLLSLELPDFFNLISDLDFVHDFGAVETTRPTPAELDRPVTEIMKVGVYVQEETGLVRSYALMLKHNLQDLPVINGAGALVGIAYRVDVGTAILSNWKSVGPPQE